MRAANFQQKELPELMHWLHRRGMKGFLTVKYSYSVMSWSMP